MSYKHVFSADFGLSLTKGDKLRRPFYLNITFSCLKRQLFMIQNVAAASNQTFVVEGYS